MRSHRFDKQLHSCASLESNINEEEDIYKTYEQHAVTLKFKSQQVEGEFLSGIAKSRLPILAALATFDALLYIIKVILHATHKDFDSPFLVSKFGHQLISLLALYGSFGALQWFSCRSSKAARHVGLVCL